MPAPQVSWFSEDNTTQVNKWDIGTVDAGDLSAEFSVLIWNNRGGQTALSDMTNCSITTKDSGGGNGGDAQSITNELVFGKWIETQVSSLGETGPTWTAIGGTTTKEIRGHAAGTPAKTIKGSANDGNHKTTASQGNYCALKLRANVPPEATAGLINFLTRVSYQYV
ncbi:hypothetical protein EEL32_20580 [Brevibacillus laterosporus]|uniref:Uncharacterized protein n=1 Tax=Brevibacillus laterosporus TaxID=1465 RepID=A0A502H3W3_BRELA|nr:hypothetical protein [Brevibacillus laterosporus]QDX94032.1 hypothetical protein EEL30_18085 [Brevibacillus laterosporus]TPG67990.1 hypothetical protein EEL31_05060 [Brevibacillus laterosporus]TPG81295.1 hypothetical protein EEL32_20580 [Brevibacillus laterosporus]